MPLKKIADLDIFDKFPHVSVESEKNMIANIPLKYAKKQISTEKGDHFIIVFSDFQKDSLNKILIDRNQNQVLQEKKANFRFAFKCNTVYRKKNSSIKRSGPEQKLIPTNYLPSNTVTCVGFSNEEFKKIIKSGDNSKKHSIKGKENDDFLIDVDQYSKSSFASNSYKNSINYNPNSYYSKSTQNVDLLNDDILENNENYTYSKSSESNSQRKPGISTNDDLLIFEENIAEIQQATPKSSFSNENQIILKILEKTIITLQNGKIRELKIFGQLLIEGINNVNNDKITLKLTNKIWEDGQFIQKRVTPKSIEVNQIGPFLYEIANNNSPNSTKSKSIFDYIVASNHFKIEKIPLMVIYKSGINEKNKNESVITIQYKVNENIEMELKDVEFEVFLENDVFFDDIQTIPPAFSFQNHILLWKVIF